MHDMSRDQPGMRPPVLAAGGVLWRPGPGGAPEVAVIHRPRYDDWSLPKGKVDRGESEPVAAVREIFEETGFRSRLGRYLGSVSYPVANTTKKVTYWVARAGDGEFRPNREVDELRWLSVPEAAELLVYPYDRKMLRRFAKMNPDTHTVLVVRHGVAGRKSRYRGNDDRLRPLDQQGRLQADALAGLLLAFGAEELHAADRTRCHQTLEPLAAELQTDIVNEPALTEEAYADSRKRARARMLEIAAGDPTPVICSQGKVIPPVIDWWCERDSVTPDKSRNRKGSVWVLSMRHGRLVAADHIASPLAVRT